MQRKKICSRNFSDDQITRFLQTQQKQELQNGTKELILLIFNRIQPK